MPDIRRVTTVDEIAATTALAREIWNQHFPSIIGQAQVDYMLATFQSEEAIRRQIREAGYEYYLVLEEGESVGYVAIVPGSGAPSALQLSKLYLRDSCRGRGLGRRVTEWLEREGEARGVREVWLTVNKDNVDSIAFYERVGFRIVESMVTDIGDGFVMDDYRMEKRLQVGRY